MFRLDYIIYAAFAIALAGLGLKYVILSKQYDAISVAYDRSLHDLAQCHTNTESLKSAIEKQNEANRLMEEEYRNIVKQQTEIVAEGEKKAKVYEAVVIPFKKPTEQNYTVLCRAASDLVDSVLKQERPHD